MPEAIVKNVVAELAPAQDDETSPHGTFEVILSAPVRDRDGETVKSDEWEQPLPEHITFDIDHGMSVASTVGSGTPMIDDQGRLVVAGSYASTALAQDTRKLVSERHIRTTSVAFLRKHDRKTGQVRRELLNGAFVAVPSNPAALVLSSKDVKEGRRNSGQDVRRIQTIHDHATELGAECAAGTKLFAENVAALDNDTQRAEFAALDTKALPEIVRALLVALGVIDPEDDDKPSAAPAETPADESAEESADVADRTAIAVHAQRLRALSTLATTPEVPRAHTA
jgi:hypothetical protein